MKYKLSNSVLRITFDISNNEERRMNKTVLRVLEIFELLSNSSKDMTVSEISKDLEIPKSSTHDILMPLLEKGYISIKNKKEKTYELGLKIFQISNLFQSKLEINQVVDPFLKELKEKTNNTVFFAVENNKKIVYLSKFEVNEGGIRTTAQLGSQNGLYYTGLGKAILATYSNEKIENYLNEIELYPRTEKTIVSKEVLLNDLKRIRERGYSIDNQEGEDNVYCIAVPIYDMNKNVLGAISMANLFTKITPQIVEQQSKMMIETALEISKKYGYYEEKLY